MTGKKCLLLWLVPGLLWAFLCLPACERQQRSNGPSSGIAQSAKSPDGLEYTHYEDERALADSKMAQGRLIALTQGGTLLAYDTGTLATAAKKVPSSPGLMLADGPAGVVLLACQDGSVYQVDPLTLNLTRLWQLEAPPLWVGCDGKSVYAALSAAKTTRGISIGPSGDARQIGSIRNLTTKADVPFAKYVEEAMNKATQPSDYGLCGMRAGMPSTLLLDSRGKLWMGKDNGEWGGFSHSLDLASGRPGPLRHSHEGIYGFIQLSDGQVWAYGGMSHMDLNRAFIKHGDDDRTDLLYETDDLRERANTTTRPSQPRAPITHIIEAKSGRLVVFAYTDVFTVDRELKDWRWLATLQLTYQPGRPDAMSSYPAVRSVNLIDGSEENIVCSTSGNGLIRVGAPSGTEHEDRFSFAHVDDIRPSPGGPLLGREDAWGSIQYWTWPVDGQPKRLGLTPKVDPGEGMAWRRSHLVCSDADSQVWAYDIGCWPGRMCLVRWSGQRQEVMAVQDGTFEIDAIFATGDGRFWMCGMDKKLKSLRQGKWEDVADIPVDHVYDVTKVLPTGPSRWLLVDHRAMLLLEESADKTIRLGLLPLRGEGEDYPWISDAVDMPKGKVLLATREALCLYDPVAAVGQWKPYPKVGHVDCLFRDDSGRLWLGGEGLWMIDRRDNLQAITSIPLLEKAKVAAIGPGPQKGGVLVSLGTRGVVAINPRSD